MDKTLPAITNFAPFYTVFQLFAAAAANHSSCRICILAEDGKEIHCNILNGSHIFMPDNAFNSTLLNAPIQSGMYVKVDDESPAYHIVAHI